MTSNAFKLTPAELKEALNGMPEDVKKKSFGGSCTAAQLLTGGPGFAWRPTPPQSTQLRRLINDLALDKQAYPSPEQLGQAMQDLEIWTGWRPMDRKMAVKVLRQVEVHEKGKKMGTGDVEELVEAACDWVEVKDGPSRECERRRVDETGGPGLPIRSRFQWNHAADDDHDDDNDGNNEEDIVAAEYATAVRELQALLSRLGIKARKDRAPDVDHGEELVQRAEEHLEKLKVYRIKSQAKLRSLQAERRSLGGQQEMS